MTTPLFHPRRMLGRTGFMATLFGIGDLAERQLPLAWTSAWLGRLMAVQRPHTTLPGGPSMSTWSIEARRTIAAADDLHLAPCREDGVTYGPPDVDVVRRGR